MPNTFQLAGLITKLKGYENMTKGLLTESNNSFDYFLSLHSILKNIHPTYIAPAYHFENYCNLLKDPEASGIFNTTLFEQTKYSLLSVEFQETFISIKSLLDRIVKIVAIKYKGVTPETTFGRFDKIKNKGKGLMGLAYQMADRDEYMQLLVQEYESWISKAVQPRDRVIHYNNLPIIYRVPFDFETAFYDDIPTIVHLNKNLKGGIDISDSEKVKEIAYDKESIAEYISSSYSLFNHTVETVMNK